MPASETPEPQRPVTIIPPAIVTKPAPVKIKSVAGKRQDCCR